MDQPQDHGGLSQGDAVAGYRIRQEIGEGSTGRVYAAVNPITGDKVAVKLLHPFRVADRAALLDGLEPLVGLTHENLLTLVRCGETDDGLVYLISEYVQGQTLADLLGRSGRLTPSEALPLLRQILAGLGAAHDRGLVHGALSPSAVWLCPRQDGSWPPRVRVTDLGLHRLGSDEPPYYLAPEQCRGEAPGSTSDLYAVGVMAYQLLAGRLPFSSAVPAEVQKMQLSQAPPPLSRELGLTVQLEALLLHLLDKDPARRHGTAAAVLVALDRLDADGAEGRSEATPRSRPSRAEGPAKHADGAEGACAGSGGEAKDLPRAARPVAAGALKEEPEPETPEPETPEPEQELEKHEKPKPLPLQVQLITTGVLPKPDLRPKPGSGLLASAVLAVIAAAAVGALAYRLFVGHWPLTAPQRSVPAAGVVVLRSVPPGAAVYLNGARQAESTPMRLTLRQGQAYDVTLHLAGHRPWRQRVALALGEPRREVEATLVRRAIRFGTLKVSVNVKADIFLDSRRVGTQTRETTLADVQAGVDHSLRISAPRHRTLEQQVRVEAGKVQVLEFRLLPES